MTTATARRPSMYQFRQTKTIPFPIEHIPNEETRQTLDDMNAGIGITTYDQKEDLYSHLRTLAKKHA